MIIQCQGCQKRHNIDEKKIPAGAKQAKCKSCGGTILLSSAPQNPARLLVNTVKSCPKCGCQLDAKKQGECPTCGIIFKRYKEAEARKKQEEQRVKAEEEQRRAQEEEERKANLVNCSVCKKEISKNAESCPNCGEPLTKEHIQIKSENDADHSRLRGLPVYYKIIIGIAGFFLLPSIFPLFGNEAFVMFLVIAWIFTYPLVFYNMSSKKRIMNIHCPNCNFTGKGKFITKGSIGIELILWLFFIIPGIVYSVWRLSNKKWICPQCHFEHVVKLGITKIS
ncbi:zinc-ribbon domain-containing protein [Candidatus Electronema sp. JC]|uniref:zinc-ribbon domain-containing protein n=1 Tax=Candidatus Electronema sp. JC TaxID=3401570 RepID=UPI003B4389B1